MTYHSFLYQLSKVISSCKTKKFYRVPDVPDADLEFVAKSGDLEALEKAAEEVLIHLNYTKKGS